VKIAANDDQSAVHGIAFQVLRFFLRHDGNAIAVLRRQPENTRSLTPSRSQVRAPVKAHHSDEPTPASRRAMPRDAKVLAP
jgi:hypothetical protein